MTQPHIPTLILAESLMLLQLSGLVYLIGQRVRDIMQGPRAWSAGLLCYALAQFCLSMEWNDVPEAAFLTDFLASLGCASFLIGLYDFTERPRRWRMLGSLLVAHVLGVLTLKLLTDDEMARLVMFSLIQFLFSLAILSALRLHVQVKRRLGIRLLRGLAYSWAAVNLFRLVIRLFYPLHGSSGFDIRELVFFILVLFFGIWLALACLLLIHERIAADLLFATKRDPLTGCLNRRGFAEALQAEGKRLIRNWAPTSMLAIDFDHFKQLNDRYGHAAGDEALIQFSAMVREELRDVDIFARLGGEEFAIVLLNAPEAGARIVAERLRKRVEDLVLHTASGPIWFTASIGVAVLAEYENDLEPLLHEADRALYEAKQAGRNRVEIFREAAVPA
ncbi:GGDEF domain-containing protein [Chitinimonas sp.]|uniref:GGDEF domain-containing protein n=1 Tax=Chitinimonas sp. TaxID=1934313 RepID=UPI002F9572A0